MGSDITKILLRKGTDAQRQTFILSQAELGFTTDTERLFIGNGSTAGGIPVSIKNWGVVSAPGDLINLAAQVNDIAFYNSATYCLTALPASTLSNWGIIAGANNGTVNSVEVGDYLNIDGNPSVKSFNQSGSIQLEVNSIMEVIYPVGTIFFTSVPYVDSNTSTSIFTNLAPGEFALKSGSYQCGVWNYLGSDTLATYSVYIYQRVA